MTQVYKPTGQVLEQYWFLRDGETGLHMFSRFAYHNSTTPRSGVFQEFRTLFRPNSTLWTTLSSSDDFYGPQPIPNPAAATGKGVATVVQDATWDLAARSNDPYVDEVSRYFTKYTFSENWRDLKAAGLFADGSTTSDNSTFGAWQVYNTRDTYFGGPTHSDLTVDGIVYNYIVSNHHGDQAPNITDGFDRTFGPFFFYVNHLPAGSTLQQSRDDAKQFADASFAADFYDSIAEHVVNYVPTSGRGSWSGKIKLPQCADKPIAILAQNGIDYQDNVFDTDAYQYWADMDSNGCVSIPRIKAGTYRLTVYAEGCFGTYTQDDIVITAGQNTETQTEWSEESAGKEIWRIGTPDRSSGEYLHGYQPDTSKPLQPPEYRIYFANWDYLNDFPNGVDFYVGKSNEATDLNYVHWSVFGGYGNSVRPVEEAGNGNINNWTVRFDTSQSDLQNTSNATFTIQLAGAKAASGNTDVYNATQPYANIPFTVNVNGQDLPTWTIPYYQSSSCAVRSAVVCYQVGNKFTFPSSYLSPNETNTIVLSLPYNATDYESAILARSIYVQYDALRLELA